jgi:hypothetical protein
MLEVPMTLTLPRLTQLVRAALAAAVLFSIGCLIEAYSRCPSCGGPVDPAYPAASATLDGQAFVFDSADCLARFLDEEPSVSAAYLSDPETGETISLDP